MDQHKYRSRIRCISSDGMVLHECNLEYSRFMAEPTADENDIYTRVYQNEGVLHQPVRHPPLRGSLELEAL